MVGGSDGSNLDGNKSGQKQMDRQKIVIPSDAIPWSHEVLAYTV